MRKRFTALFLAVIMMFAMSSVAFAADNDPNMTSFDGTFSTTLTPSASTQTVDFMAVPADAYYQAAYFSTEQAADNVQWSVMDAGLTGVTVSGYTIPLDEGQYLAAATVTVPQTILADGSKMVGTVSVKAVNPVNNSYVNFTVVVNDNKADVTGVTYKFYDGDTELLTLNDLTVSGNDYYSNILFPTALDGVMKVWADTNNLPGNAAKLKATDISYGYINGLTFEVNGIETAYTNYTADDFTYYGWQYRVYDSNGNMLPASEFIGADDFGIDNNYTVVWKFGEYGKVF